MESIRHYKGLLKLGVPIMIGQLGIIVLSFADTIMVGWHSTEELAAAGFVNNLFNLAIVFSTGFSYGITPIVGSSFGKGDKGGVGAILKNALVASGVMSLLVLAVMLILFFCVGSLGQPEELLPIIRPYYLVILASIPFVMLFNAFRQFADGITDTDTSMWILLSGNLLNIFLNWVLIYGKMGLPELGLMGAGVATLVSRVMMLVAFVLVFFLFKRYTSYKEGFLRSNCSKQECLKINRLGIPVALQMGMETASFSLSTIMVGWLGTIALASHQVMLTVGQMGFMLYYGMAAAVSIKVSVFKGEGDMKVVKSVARSGIHIIFALAFVVSVIMLLLRNKIGLLFSDNEAVVQMVAALILPFALYQFGDGLQCNYSNVLRGLEDVKPAMIIAILAYFIISLPIGYLFGFVFDWGLVGIWLSYFFGLTSAGAMFYYRFVTKW